MEWLKLTVNEEKTRVCEVPEGEFDFLGYTFGLLYRPQNGKPYLGYRPSKKSIRRMVEKIHALTAYSMSWHETTLLVYKLNRMLRGWANYFNVGTFNRAYRHSTTIRRRGCVGGCATNTKSGGIRTEAIHLRTFTRHWVLYTWPDWGATCRG
jgi:hypothetical protein